MNEIRRKHFRFPAYDDEIGVKLAKNQRRVLFDGQDDLLTENNNQPMFEQMQEFHFAQGDAREQRKRRNLSNSKKSTIPKENLVRHKEQLPDYHTHQASNRPLTNQRTRKAADSMNSQKSQEQHTSTKAYTSNQQKNGRGRSYFVPKYVPASIIPDPKVSSISDAELVDSMKKMKDSYLLFDNEPVPYQTKKAGSPSVQPFNKAEKEPLSATSKRKDKNHGILERSLKGLIEEQGNSLGENSYFK
ncbi:hypothetical protein P7D44_08845 [Enterococcus hirae]|uniref:hypothetical protein n=1 Tax=Enterococcus hirae TaxID=1354 RepID=UPI002891E48A|nr:hypothetical protein [Enterococcus hirae]MDT2650444.1 hypothetical protein [Enterococcus hirae]